MNKYLIKCIETGEVGDYTYFASKGWGFAKDAIRAAIKSGKPTKKGFHFEIDVEEKPAFQSRKGKNTGTDNPFYGKHHSEETKRKLSELKKSETYKESHPLTDSTRRKLSEAAKRNPGYEMTPEIRAKMSKSHAEALQNGKCKSRYEIDGVTFDSKWEAAFYLFHREAGNDIKRGVKIPLGNNRHYLCDFEVNGRLYEIKSLHFFDERGHLFNPYNKVPDFLKEKALDDYNVTIITDPQPYLDWADSYFCPGFVDLFKVKRPFPYGDFPVYHCNKKGKKSPYDAWFDMDLRQKAIENRLLWGPFGKNEKDNWKDGVFMPKHDRITSYDIVQAFSIANIAPKVSVLRESKVILPEGCKTVVNPFCGFGAVIRKCKKLEIDVTAYDIQNVCNEDIIIQDLTDEDFIDTKEYDCLFCCPPYLDKEEWTVEMPKILTCDDWIDLCLEKFPNCKKYIFIVDESKKHEYNGDIENQSHLGKSSSKEHYIFLKK